VKLLKKSHGPRRSTKLKSASSTVKTLLDRAISAYGNLPQPHTLALWNAQGVELTNEQETLRDAHVKDSDVLTLRPSVVKGG
jgi:hypothetical protein